VHRAGSLQWTCLLKHESFCRPTRSREDKSAIATQSRRQVRQFSKDFSAEPIGELGDDASVRVSIALTFLVMFGLCRPENPYIPTAEDVPDLLSGLACSFHGATSDCCSDELFFPSGCEQLTRPLLEDSAELAMSAGLTYSLDCMERHNHETPQCPMVSDSGSLLPCEVDCQVFHGAQEEGDPCDAVGYRMSDCRQELVCGADRVCHQPCDAPLIAPAGGYCGAARGMWFVTCDTGLACGVDGTCQPAQGIGEPCDDTSPCAPDSWCDPNVATCVARLGGGASCYVDEACQSRICKDGLCFVPESPECGRWAW
jgi:hypothetical protein